MSIREILAVLGVQGVITTLGIGAVLAVLSLVEVSKIRINPWTAIGKWLGKKVNAEVLNELSGVKSELSNVKDDQKEMKKALDDHVTADEQRTATSNRARILHFNNTLLRGIPHTKEEFIEVLTAIDDYEKYCKFHEDYKNNRATLAIENIRETYRERLKRRDFLQEGIVSDAQEANKG